MSFFQSLFGKSDKQIAKSLEGIFLGMTKEEVIGRKGQPLESRTEIVSGTEVELCVFGAYDASLYWLTVAFINDRVIRVNTSSKIKGMGVDESIP